MSNRAVAVLRGEKGVEGTVWLRQDKESHAVKICGKITGLAPGKHGIHIHVYGDATKGCESAGPHLNPDAKTHGGPKEVGRHMGDLGNIEADSNGEARFEMTDDMIKIHGEDSVIGRSIVIHEKEDDLGKGTGHDEAESLKSGNTGGRLACGVIGHAAPED